MTTASEVIESIKRLSEDEQSEVVAFAYALSAERSLRPAELTSLATRLARSAGTPQSSIVREAIETGFYGPDSDA